MKINLNPKNAKWIPAIAIAIVLVGSGLYDSFATPGVNQTAGGGSIQSDMPCSYYVFPDASNPGTFISQNCDTHQIAYGGTGNIGGVLGTSSSAIMNASIIATTSGGIVQVAAGIYNPTTTIGISNSNITIYLMPGAIFNFPSNVNYGFMITKSFDTITGGGTLEGTTYQMISDYVATKTIFSTTITKLNFIGFTVKPSCSGGFGATVDAVALQNSYYATISNNLVNASGAAGSYGFVLNSVGILGAKVTDNTILKTACDSIFVRSPSTISYPAHNIISGNVIYDSLDASVEDQGYYDVITQNTVLSDPSNPTYNAHGAIEPTTGAYQAIVSNNVISWSLGITTFSNGRTYGCYGCTISNNILNYSYYGINNPNWSPFMTINNNQIYFTENADPNMKGAITSAGGNFTAIIDNMIYKAYDSGIVVNTFNADGTYDNIDGNTIVDPGQSLANTYYGINMVIQHANTPIKNFNVENNIIFDDQGVRTMAYALRFADNGFIFKFGLVTSNSLGPGVTGVVSTGSMLISNIGTFVINNNDGFNPLGRRTTNYLVGGTSSVTIHYIQALNGNSTTLIASQSYTIGAYNVNICFQTVGSTSLVLNGGVAFTPAVGECFYLYPTNTINFGAFGGSPPTLQLSFG